MDIPVVIFKEAGSVYGVNVPGIKGVHSLGDTVEESLENVRQAITSHIETLLELGRPVEISQSKIGELQDDPQYAGGTWALVAVELDKLDRKHGSNRSYSSQQPLPSSPERSPGNLLS